MIHLALFVLFVVTIEIAYRLRLLSHLSSVHGVLIKAGRVLGSSNISDHWKEKALLAYSVKLTTSCLRLCLVLGLVVACFFLGDLFYPGILAHLTTLRGIVASIFIGCVWMWVRTLFVSKH